MTTEKYKGEFPNWVDLSGNIIATTAKELAYTEKYFKAHRGKCTWNSKRNTHATDIFMKAINKVFPKRSGWSKQCQDGASCDVGVATVLRYCGADKDIPRGLDGQFPRFKKSSKFKDMRISKSKNARAGDIGLYKNRGKGAHIWINLGNGVVAESNHTAKYFFHIITKNINDGVGRKEYHCYRMITPIRKYMKQGDCGSEILKLQKFLNWAGFNCGSADGVFGEGTLKAVKAFQSHVGLKADGEFGEGSLAKAKVFTKDVKPTPPPTPTKKPYSGTFPKLPARRYFKRGDKGIQVKYLQKFLNWYGKYGLVVDGVIGSKTIVAVEKFQKSEKLDVDGLFGKKCLAKAKQAKR